MTAICDTGPLVAYLNRRDPYHARAVAVMKQIKPPMLTCEAVLTEVVYFLREDGLDVDPLFQMFERGALRVQFDISAYWPRIRTLMTRRQRMDLADASIGYERIARPCHGVHGRSQRLQHLPAQ
jgi:predicted nucleic acid-binding protein